MKRCARCWMPDTRPGSQFDENGVCLACRNYDERASVNWTSRYHRLTELCYEAKKEAQHRNLLYDCVVPVSGGKDSHRLVSMMMEHEMNPLLVTVTDPFTHTKAGQHNLNNIIERFRLNHYTYTINHDLFRRATRWAFENRGEPLKFVEHAIYTIPTRLADAMHIPLVMYGEYSPYEYGSTNVDTWDGLGTVYGMRKALLDDLAWWEAGGVSEQEVRSILPPNDTATNVAFMSYFIPWSSLTNQRVAKDLGFIDLKATGEWDRAGTIEQFEQIDSVGYMFHLWMKYPKFGFQRVSDIASRRVREGVLDLEEAKKLIEEHDWKCDPWARDDFQRFCGYRKEEMDAIIEAWTVYPPPA